MAIVKPFKCYRPNREVVSQVAALPYDVYSKEEARDAVKGNLFSFLNIDRPETQFSPDMDMYADEVYQKARTMLEGQIKERVYVTDGKPCYYLYRLVWNGKSQTGFVGCCSIDDYQRQTIKKHENTREEKEQDRIRHVDTLNAQTGPIFLAYRSQETLNRMIGEITKKPPLYDFTSEDQIGHQVWVVDQDQEIAQLQKQFEEIPYLYIADGHHRAASAVKVGLKRRQENPGYTGEEPFNFFLSVLFPDDQLTILPYNRVVRDLNGYTKDGFLQKVSESFSVEKVNSAFGPEEKGEFGMYLDGAWYCLKIKPEKRTPDPVEGLDVSLLQTHLLNPVLGIQDPRLDNRIDFIGGIRGLKELERRVAEDMEAAFSLYPTSIQELFEVADAGRLMPPKSTWFEPKLRSGIFIHRLSE